MHFMNRWDIDEAQHRFHPRRFPELAKAVTILVRLRDWTDANSDGWAYWPKPVRAADRLMTLIEAVDPVRPVDVTAAQVQKACQPIKSFLTRQGVHHDFVFSPEED